jgi:hypothetical protein
MSLTAPPCKQAPTIYSRQATVTVQKGKNVNLSCVVESKDCGTGILGLYWRNPNGRIQPKTRTKTEVVASGGRNSNVRKIMTLTIKHAKTSGAYKCIISGTSFKASSTVQLTVG